jgi:hypothetical protein
MQAEEGDGGNGWWVGLGVRGFREVGRAEIISGMRGASFLAEFGMADLRSSNRASHLNRAERLFLAKVGSAQTRGLG